MLLLCIASLVIALLLPTEDQPIELFIVDADQTTESTMMVQLLVLTIASNDYLTIKQQSLQEAEYAMQKGDITSYIIFPKDLTENLYAGQPVTLQLVGHPEKIVDSYIIQELMNSLARYIESAQANILTTYTYAKQLNLSKVEQNAYLKEQFIDFSMFTLNKGQLLWEHEIENLTTSAPLYYYSIAALWILFTGWLLGIYLLLRQSESRALTIRLQLLGVTHLQRNVARMVWTCFISHLWLYVTFAVVAHFLMLQLFLLDYGRLLLYSLLYSVCVCFIIAIIDRAMPTVRSSLMLQLGAWAILVLTSGAVLPTLYFPLALQQLLPYLFSFSAFQWVIDIAIEERNYASYHVLWQSMLVLLILWLSMERWKERWHL